MLPSVRFALLSSSLNDEAGVPRLAQPLRILRQRGWSCQAAVGANRSLRHVNLADSHVAAVECCCRTQLLCSMTAKEITLMEFIEGGEDRGSAFVALST